eukprot:Lithocolla_globosa_v1_NODE_354_length_4343_cov_21.892024.p3 type:complete len:164 gc:universal NODE_354_length_4343_cov_21.892024:3800-4291(+)
MCHKTYNGPGNGRTSNTGRLHTVDTNHHYTHCSHLGRQHSYQIGNKSFLNKSDNRLNHIHRNSLGKGSKHFRLHTIQEHKPRKWWHPNMPCRQEHHKLDRNTTVPDPKPEPTSPPCASLAGVLYSSMTNCPEFFRIGQKNSPDQSATEIRTTALNVPTRKMLF